MSRILPGDRYVDTADPTDTGTFTYRRTTPNTAAVTFTNRFERCDSVLTCTTMTTGTFRTNCDEFGVGPYTSSGTWELQPPTQTGPPPPVVDVWGEYNPGLRIGNLLLGISGARISEGVTRIRVRYRPAGRSWWDTTIWIDLWCGDLRCPNLDSAEEVDPGTYEVQFQAGFAPPSTSVSTWSESVLVAVPSTPPELVDGLVE